MSGTKAINVKRAVEDLLRSLETGIAGSTAGLQAYLDAAALSAASAEQYAALAVAATAQVQEGKLYASDYGDSLSAMLTAASTDNYILVFTPGVYSVPGNLTVPETVTLDLDNGAVLTPANGVTITIKGHIRAGFYRIFNTSLGGTIAFGSVTESSTHGVRVHPEWWGAVGNNSTDCSAAIRAAVNSVKTSRGVVEFGTGWFGISSSITIEAAQSISIIGQGSVATAIVFKATNIIAFEFLGVSENIRIRDMWIGSLTDNLQYRTTAIRIVGNSSSLQASEIVITDIRIQSAQTGVYLKFCSGVTMRNVFITEAAGSGLADWQLTAPYTAGTFVRKVGHLASTVISDATSGAEGGIHYLMYCSSSHTAATTNEPLVGSGWSSKWAAATGVGIYLSYVISSRFEKISVVTSYNCSFSSDCILVEGGCDTLTFDHIEVGNALDHGMNFLALTPSAWTSAYSYVRADIVIGGSSSYAYACIDSHISAATNEPYDGAFFANRWNRIFVTGPRLVKIHSAYIERCFAAGLSIDDGIDVAVHDSHLIQNATGLSITGGAFIRVHDSLIGFTDGHAVVVSGTADVALVGNKVLSFGWKTPSTYSGIVVLAGVENCKIVSNDIGSVATWNHTLNGAYGITAAASTDYLTVLANSIRYTVTDILWQSAGTHNYIEHPAFDAWQQFTDGDTTPSVNNYTHFYCVNSATTLVTGFDGGRIGQHIYVTLDVLTTIKHNGAPAAGQIANANSQDIRGNAFTVLEYVKNGSGVWLQVNGFPRYPDSFDNFYVNGVAVVGAQGAPIANVSGGAATTAQDPQARTAVNTLLQALRNHGLIDT